MTSSIFLDVNVWLALHHQVHLHHESAKSWFDSLDDDVVLVFCRLTQMGFFRLMTTDAILGNEKLTQRQCWALYDKWIDSERAQMDPEPPELESIFRTMSSTDQASPKEWADSYLAAFAQAGGMRLVTFDRALAAKAKGAVLLA